MVTRIPICFVD